MLKRATPRGTHHYMLWINLKVKNKVKQSPSDKHTQDWRKKNEKKHQVRMVDGNGHPHVMFFFIRGNISVTACIRARVGDVARRDWSAFFVFVLVFFFPVLWLFVWLAAFFFASSLRAWFFFCLWKKRIFAVTVSSTNSWRLMSQRVPKTKKHPDYITLYTVNWCCRKMSHGKTALQRAELQIQIYHHVGFEYDGSFHQNVYKGSFFRRLT